jgi:hypothetical protein
MVLKFNTTQVTIQKEELLLKLHTTSSIPLLGPTAPHIQKSELLLPLLLPHAQ